MKTLIITNHCPCQESEIILVRIDADLSCSGLEKWRQFKIDKCVAPFVYAFQNAGINMRASCCGHGKGPMRIDLSGGGIIKIYQK